MPFESGAEFYKPGYVRGYVFDPEALGTRWAVGLFHNGHLVGTYFADLFTQEQSRDPRTPGDCGFEFNLNKAVFRDADTLTIKVLNTGHIIVDTPMKSMQAWREAGEQISAGTVRHANGLTLTGHLNDTVSKHPSYEILAYDGDRIVGRSRLYRWQHIGNPRNANGRRVGFELLIDPDLADGVPRKLRVETSTGMAVEGSPVDFIAYPNSMREPWLVAEGRRRTRSADMALDRILENSVPLNAYAEHYPKLAAAPVPAKQRKSFGENGQFWKIPKSDWTLVSNVAVSPRKDIAPLLRGVDGDLAYFDLGVRKGDDVFPLLFPAFDLERLLEQGYAALCFAARDNLVQEALSKNPRSPFEMFLTLIGDVAQSDTLRKKVLHIPHPGGLLEEAQLRDTCGLHETVLHDHLPTLAPGAGLASRADTVFPAVRVKRPNSDRAVSVVIPTRDEGAMLYECIDSLIRSNPEFDLDILVVDNGSREEETAEVFCDLENRGVRILEYDDGFNFSQINNLAVEHARHEQLCLLNNDVRFPEHGVLGELCSRLADPSVGAVGPLMVRATDIIQHGGVVLGPSNGATHAFEDRMRGDVGYGEMLCVARQCSAVTGAMMLTRKTLFQSLSGFEETLFAVNFNDVDYCLRLQSSGYRIVFTPHCYVQHFESVSRGRELASPSGNRMLREVHNLRLRWRDVIMNDPFTHPLLSTDTMPYRALCSRHRVPGPRTSEIRPSADLPSWI
jgi:GT2 family glycosyltransferase